ncbi:MAG: endonuclease [Chloroflexi bacterium]|nr:endonuclease [Chloroflexota bacterium]
MVVEHIVPLIGGGSSAEDNLCISCYRCNEFKGPRQLAPDALTDQSVALFHPRRQRWTEHFSWEADSVRIRGLTPCGRATLALLRLNNSSLVQARRIWILVGLQPPLE